MDSFVSLFSGAGGLDLGLEAAGWNCLYATDIDQRAIETLQSNRGFALKTGAKVLKDAHVERSDVRTLSGRDILSISGRRRGEVALLAGGPPCQSWSSAGHQLGFGDERGRLLADYFRIAEQLDTRWLLFENVRGLLTARGHDGTPGSALAFLRSELLRRGWQSRVELLNSADFGVAQRRVRLLLVGYRTGDAPSYPPPTHSQAVADANPQATSHGSPLKAWVSLEQCLAQIAPPGSDEIIRPRGKMAQDLMGLLPGTGAKSPGKRETTRPGGHWGYKQGAFIADLKLPARTITASSQQDWIRDPVAGLRRLSPRECSAIQSFPVQWSFSGGRSDQYRLIGNAVPPLLAFRLGAALRTHSGDSSDADQVVWRRLEPLPDRLQSAIEYTAREERANGASRRTTSQRNARNQRLDARERA